MIAVRGRICVALVILGCAGPTIPGWSARAEDTGRTDLERERAEGRRHFEQAERHYEAGQFAQARLAYETGYRLTRLPGFLINVAQCHRMMGELRLARGHYRKFLLVSPKSPRRGEVEEMIAELDKAIAEAAGAPADASDFRRDTPSGKWWIWSALAGSVVGTTVATMTVAASEEPPDTARR